MTPSESDAKARTYTTKHGTTATMNTAAIGKSAPKDDDEMETAEVESEGEIVAGDYRRVSLPAGVSWIPLRAVTRAAF